MILSRARGRIKANSAGRNPSVTGALLKVACGVSSPRTPERSWRSGSGCGVGTPRTRRIVGDPRSARSGQAAFRALGGLAVAVAFSFRVPSSPRLRSGQAAFRALGGLAVAVAFHFALRISHFALSGISPWPWSLTPAKTRGILISRPAPPRRASCRQAGSSPRPAAGSQNRRGRRIAYGVPGTLGTLRIVSIAGGGRQRAVVWKMSDKGMQKCQKNLNLNKTRFLLMAYATNLARC